MPAHVAQRKVKVTTWLHPSLKDVYEQHAKTEGLDLSKLVAARLAESEARRLHIQHAGVLEPIIDQAVAKGLAKLARELRKTMFRTYYSAEFDRAMLFNVIRWKMGLTEAEANAMIDGAKQDAQRSTKLLAAEVAAILAEILPGASQAA